MDEMQEILEEFFTEADESLDELESDLIKLETLAEEGNTDAELVDRLFRVLHTLKGGAGFLGLDRMNKLAHAGENLLDEVRGGKVMVCKSVMDALLKTNDLLKELLDVEKSGGDPEEVDTTDVVKALENLASGGEAPAEEPAPATPEAPVEEVAEPVAEEPAAETPAAEAPAVEINTDLLDEINADDRLSGPALDASALETPAAEAPAVEINTDLLDEINADDRLSGPALDASVLETPVAEEPAVEVNQDLLDEINADDRLSGPAVEAPVEEPVVEVQEAVVEKPKAEPAKEEGVLKRGEAKPEERREKADRRKADDRRKQPRRTTENADVTIRVETSKLDKTMNLVGELVLARNSLLRFINTNEMRGAMQNQPGYNEVMTNLEHLSRVTKDLQMSVLSTRMQPIKKVFDKIPRQVRELKNKLGKEIDVKISGEFTEVDKSLVEELSDPMVHIIRNSLDHGIEMPDDREEIGKPRQGTVSVGAFYEGNKVVIQVKDDGAGIDPDKIRKVAVKKGVIDERTAANLSDKEAVNLVMAPGFSTAETISDVSGRGVGMDVVNSSIQNIKGSVEIHSEFGVGTTINIYLPLTLAIVQALVVRAQSEGFAIPIGDISEVIKFNANEIHQVNDQDVIELRGQVLPLFYLGSLTRANLPQYRAVIVEDEKGMHTEVVADGEAAPVEDKHAEDTSTNGYIVVVREGSHSLGVVADGLIGQEEAVVKAISDTFEYNPAVSGATITGDGRVHMILDVPYVIKQSSHKLHQRG